MKTHLTRPQHQYAPKTYRQSTPTPFKPIKAAGVRSSFRGEGEKGPPEFSVLLQKFSLHLNYRQRQGEFTQGIKTCLKFAAGLGIFFEIANSIFGIVNYGIAFSVAMAVTLTVGSIFKIIYKFNYGQPNPVLKAPKANREALSQAIMSTIKLLELKAWLAASIVRFESAVSSGLVTSDGVLFQYHEKPHDLKEQIFYANTRSDLSVPRIYLMTPDRIEIYRNELREVAEKVRSALKRAPQDLREAFDSRGHHHLIGYFSEVRELRDLNLVIHNLTEHLRMLAAKKADFGFPGLEVQHFGDFQDKAQLEKVFYTFGRIQRVLDRCAARLAILRKALYAGGHPTIGILCDRGELKIQEELRELTYILNEPNWQSRMPASYQPTSRPNIRDTETILLDSTETLLKNLLIIIREKIWSSVHEEGHASLANLNDFIEKQEGRIERYEALLSQIHTKAKAWFSTEIYEKHRN